MNDYPEEPDEVRHDREMVSTAESNAPPEYLAAISEFDRVAERSGY